ncbi:flavin reductase [Marinicella sp. S1101]|uniref:flavin reductase family protein n=1 Tax=Marinicella marina TaxID=2996016 RepID=UPI002260921A|nr:flavin reductase [Marinicella marina]MCX7552828.1 flavin reductase [Marinicella marina]MDJ1139863.1 flavin reductase [Marinicella marina]
MLITQQDLKDMDRIVRLNMVNSITGVKPANLIGTQDQQGNKNLAIFSSVVHLGSNPALLGFITRPAGEVPRHTLENILETDFYTINHVPTDMVEQAHQTSAKYKKDISEFERCGFDAHHINDFSAPFVKQAAIKIGMQLAEIIPIERNGTQLVIGEIKLMSLADELVSDEGYINLEQAQTAGLSGLNSYYKLSHLDSFPYARPDKG